MDYSQQVIPILFMFGVVTLLGPLVGFTMWAAFDGDRHRSDEESAVGEAAHIIELANAHDHADAA